MNTKYRLDEVFMRAERVPFNERSKFVFMGDVHRGDNSLSDEFGRNRHIYYRALDYYFQNGFTYVEVGDGDEIWEVPKYSHIRSAHPMVFDLLRKFYMKERMIMLYGNHNMQLKQKDYVRKNLYRYYSDDRDEHVDLFPGIKIHEGVVLEHEHTGQEIFVVHGHQGDFMNDQFWKLSCFLVRYLWRFMHVAGVKYAASPAKSRTKRHKVEKNFNKWIDEHRIMMICGHTHRAKFPTLGELPYFNTGCCMHPRGITCLEIEDDKITLVSWHMHSQEDGMLYIKRSEVNTAKPLAQFRNR